MAEDLALIGLNEESDAYAQRAFSLFELWPENVTSVEVFQALSSQWRTISVPSPFGGTVLYQGIDYGSIKDVMSLMEIKKKRWSEIFTDLRIMERAALAVINK